MGSDPGLIKLSQNAKAFEVAPARSPCIPKPAPITLSNSEALFSPSTRIRDLALAPSLFRWESRFRRGGCRGWVDGWRGQPPSTLLK
jgi:hypothetical protein